MDKNKILYIAEIIITLLIVNVIKSTIIAYPIAILFNYGWIQVLNRKSTETNNLGAATTIANVVFICTILMFVFMMIFDYVLSMAFV